MADEPPAGDHHPQIDGEELLDLGERLLAAAKDAAASGLLGYGLLIGRVPV